MKLRLAPSTLTALAVLTLSLFTAAGSADASIITLQFTGTVSHGFSGPVFGEPGPVAVDFSLTYDTSKGSQVAFVQGPPDGDSFYGYSAAGLTASSLTFGTKTWTLSDLWSQSIKGQDADFWTNADLTLGAPSAVAITFGDGAGILKLGRVYLKTGHSLFDTIDVEEFLPDSYLAVGGNYDLSTSVAPAAVPEPASLLFVGTGLVGLAMRWRASKGH